MRLHEIGHFFTIERRRRALKVRKTQTRPKNRKPDVFKDTCFKIVKIPVGTFVSKLLKLIKGHQGMVDVVAKKAIDDAFSELEKTVNVRNLFVILMPFVWKFPK
jgi:hypothetical protein